MAEHISLPEGHYTFPSFAWLKQAHYRATTPGAGMAMLNRRKRLQKREGQHGAGADEMAASDAGGNPSA